MNISGNAGVANAVINYTGTSSGSVNADAAGNFVIPGLSNGTYVVTPTLAGYTFSPASQTATIIGKNITAVNFSIAWSSQDSRGPLANGFRIVNGTQIFDVQTPYIPVVDSRGPGVPVQDDSLPHNCRTPGKFGANLN